MAQVTLRPRRKVTAQRAANMMRTEPIEVLSVQRPKTVGFSRALHVGLLIFSFRATLGIHLITVQHRGQ